MRSDIQACAIAFIIMQLHMPNSLSSYNCEVTFQNHCFAFYFKPALLHNVSTAFFLDKDKNNLENYTKIFVCFQIFLKSDEFKLFVFLVWNFFSTASKLQITYLYRFTADLAPQGF